MAHFARIKDGIVQQVIVIKNEVLLDANGVEQESIGSQFCTDTFGGTWVQTSYNGNFRNKFANNGDLWNGQEFYSVPILTGEVV